MDTLEEHFFGIPLSTHRDDGQFPFELLIAAIAIFFSRTTIHQSQDPKALRWFFATMLAFLAYSNKSYELIASVEFFSYLVPFCLYSEWPIQTLLAKDSKLLRLALIALSAPFSWVLCHLVATGRLFAWIHWATPTLIQDSFASMFPTKELEAAYNILDRFVMEPGLLRYQVNRLLFVTFHIQCGIGYLGIDFLRAEQERRNELARLDVETEEEAADDDKNDTSANKDVADNAKDKPLSQKTIQHRLKKSSRFQRTAAPFILYAAVPYMIKTIAYGNLNAFAFACFKDDIHRAVRLHDLFEEDNKLVAVATHSAKAPAAYAEYMDTIVSTSYDLFNRKLFSLPKVLLLPMVMARQPTMMAQIFPIIFLTDWIKGRAVAYMTSRIETLQKEIQELNAVRSKVESFDIKNAELLLRAGSDATEFTKRRWENLTVRVQMKTVVMDLITRTKGFFAYIQRNWVFTVLVDCALAHLIAVGKLVSADVFVFSRAIEDAVDMALMKSRSEAELARMMTQIDNMEELATVWDDAKTRTLLHCNLAPPNVAEKAVESHASMVVLRNLLYSRGTAIVRVDHMELEAGIYALTGGNGSGKSTLFRVLMGCDTNERAIDLPPSIVLSTPFEPIIEEDDIEREQSCEAADEEGESTLAAEDEVVVAESRQLTEPEEAHPRLSITMPSSHVVEISQTFYWPLYSRPIDWIFHDADAAGEGEMQRMVRRVAEELNTLEFSQHVVDLNQTEPQDDELSPTEEMLSGIMAQLLEEKEDWFSDLSGGQRSKVELVRKVFLQDECPHVLLVDETMAPLDPKSKALVMAKLKEFCAASVIIVIYHTDVGREQEGEGGEAVECVPSNGFFDANIHVENKMMQLRPVC